MKGALSKRLDSLAADLRSQMRDKNIRHSGINREGERISIRFRDAETRNKARTLLENDQPSLALTEQGDGDNLRLDATLKPTALKEIQESAIRQNMGTLHNRINDTRPGNPIHEKFLQLRDLMIKKGVKWPPLPPAEVRARGGKAK